MKVFLAGTSLLPDYGGPAFSVSRLAMALAEAGAEVGLWAPDQSAAVTPLLSARFDCATHHRHRGRSSGPLRQS